MKYLFNLRSLDLSGNLLTQLDDSSFDDVTGLTRLDISNNLISILSNRVFHNVTRLESLNLAANHLVDFPTSTFIPLDKLEDINVASNQLQFIPIALQGLRQVRRMNISHNDITRLRMVADSGGSMASIRELVLSGTTMTEVDGNDLNLCPNLITRHCRHCRIFAELVHKEWGKISHEYQN